MRNWGRIDLLVVLAALTAATLWIDFSAIHRYQNADSLIMVFISVYRWTPMCWEQDRLGMVFPLLALPWRDPWNNMLAQAGMNIFACLAGFFLVGYYTAGRRLGTAAGAVGAILFLAFLPAAQQFSYLVTVHHFGSSSAIGLAGLILVDRWSLSNSRVTLTGAAICLVAAHWINPGVALALAPMLLLRRVCFAPLLAGLADEPQARRSVDAPSVARSTPAESRGGTRSWSAAAAGWVRTFGPGRAETVGLVLVAVSLAASVIHSRTVSDRQSYRFVWPADWLSTATFLWQNRYDDFDARWFRAVDATALVGLATFLLRSGRRAARVSLPLAGGLLVAAFAQFAFMSSLDHVRAGHTTRYTMMAIFFWQAALVGFAAVQVGAVIGRLPLAAALPRVLTVAIVLVAAIVSGRPGSDLVRAQIDATMSQYTDDILAAGCTHVTGDYWRVWPATFHANLRLAESGSPRRVWAITHRSRATQKYWRAVPLAEMRVAEIIGDEQWSSRFLAHYHAPRLAPCGQIGRIRVLRPVDESDASVAAGQARPAR